MTPSQDEGLASASKEPSASPSRVRGMRSSSTHASDESIAPLDLDELEPLSPLNTGNGIAIPGADAHRRREKASDNGADYSADRRSSIASTASSSNSVRSARGNARSVSFLDDRGEGPSSMSSSAPAQYVTVSSILSRSGAAITPSHYSDARSEDVHWSRRRGSQDRYGSGSVKRRPASNGSALEALGALFLQRDSSGKVSNLSAARVRKRQKAQDAAQSAHATGRWELATLSRVWMQSVNNGAQRLGIEMPKRHDAGQTIAQRRARAHANRQDDAEEEGSRYVKVGSRDSDLIFEVGTVDDKEHTFLSRPRAVSRSTAPPLAPRMGGRDEEDSPSPLFAAQYVNGSRRDDPVIDSSSVYGVGSAFSLIDPPEAPPSPVAMPGAWSAGGRGWARDPFEEGALMLPPPLLDDQGSDAQSFEGLLGVRRRREQELAKKRFDLLKSRNRPAHKVGMLTAMSNFVKAARAADQAAKAQSQRAGLIRRHTEPTQKSQRPQLASQQQQPESPVEDLAYFAGSTDTNASKNDGQDMRRTGSQSRSSVDSVKALPTVYEAVPLDSTDFDTDRTHGRNGSGRSNPLTPSIGPTLLSLPPSPWTPYGGSSEATSTERLAFSLGMTVVQGPPGTPRLIPSHLEVTSSYDADLGALTPIALSPRALGLDHRQDHGLVDPSPFLLSPGASPYFATAQGNGRHDSSLRRRKIAPSNLDLQEEDRLTPSAVLQQTSTSEPSIVKAPAFDPADARKTVVTTTAKRSLLLWFFIGNLGLRQNDEGADKTDGSATSGSAKVAHASIAAIIALLLHVYGFFVFVLADLFDLSYRCYDVISTIAWFSKWLFLNLTGRTVLSQCVVDSYRIVRREWEMVSREDHEGKGLKRRRGSMTSDGGEEQEASAKYRGLTRWQVVKGLIELYCLQDVTRERYLKEGAGLKELVSKHNSGHRERASNGVSLDGNDASDVGESSDESVSSDDDMLVTRQSLDILEFVKTPRFEPKRYFEKDQDNQESRRKGRKGGQKETKTARDIVKIIKWASRLSISAYGLHVTLVDLPPTFTPSGDRFSRQTFAHLSRLHHEDVLHADIQTLDSQDYSPTFYLVRDMARKTIAVSVRGTQSLQDIIVDLDIVVDELKLNDDEVDGDNEETYYCHAGVLRAAKALIAQDSTLFQTLSSALEANPDFDIVFTGHSLGGAIASTVVLLLSRLDTEHKEGIDDEQGTWVTHKSSGLPIGRRIRAITFAHPATVSANLAARSSRGNPPLVLTVTLGYDFVPRCGHGQAREVRRALGALSRVRRRKRKRHLLSRQNSRTDFASDNSPEDGADTTEDHRVHIVTSWWQWRGIKRKADNASRDELRTMRGIEDALWRLRCDVENDLYTAVKTRSTRGDEGRTSAQGDADGSPKASRHLAIPPSPWIGPTQRSAAPLHELATRRQALDAITLANEEEISQRAGGLLVPAGQSLWLHDDKVYTVTSPLSFFGMPDLHPQMFIHHFPSAYEDMLESL